MNDANFSSKQHIANEQLSLRAVLCLKGPGRYESTDMLSMPMPWVRTWIWLHLSFRFVRVIQHLRTVPNCLYSSSKCRARLDILSKPYFCCSLCFLPVKTFRRHFQIPSPEIHFQSPLQLFMFHSKFHEYHLCSACTCRLLNTILSFLFFSRFFGRHGGFPSQPLRSFQ